MIRSMLKVLTYNGAGKYMYSCSMGSIESKKKSLKVYVRVRFKSWME